METAVYTISARGKEQRQPIEDYFCNYFPTFSVDEIESVFGFVEPSTLYSGRPFFDRQISDKDIEFLYRNNIGLKLPFTNHFVSREEYVKNKDIFEKYHRHGNSIIATNDEFASWIRNDFPFYKIEASMLKEIDSEKKIYDAFELYDMVVLPMTINNNLNFLEKIEQKNRIILFGNAGCAYTCPNRICYKYISKRNKVLASCSKIPRFFYSFYFFFLCKTWCSHKIRPRKLNGIRDFDLDRLYQLGFSHFKILRESTQRKTAH